MKKESNYEFRKRMLQVHRINVRDYNLLPGESEFVIDDGFFVVLPDEAELNHLGTNVAGEKMDAIVIETAARDFVDYLYTSMGISAMLTVKVPEVGDNYVRLKLNQDLGLSSSAMSYRITVGEGILLEGYDARGLAQGLYHLEDRMNLRMAPYLQKGVECRKTMFTTRNTMSGYGIDMYPDQYLCKLAHEGITGISLWVKDVDTTLRGYLDFNDLGYLCAEFRSPQYSPGGRRCPGIL